MSEKQYQTLSSELPSHLSRPHRQSSKLKLSIISACILLPLLPLLALFTDWDLPLPDLTSFVHKCGSSRPIYTASELAQAKCPKQPPALNIGSDWNPLNDDDFAHLAAIRLSKAVQIKTESFDDLPYNTTDPRWDKHYKFSEFLESEYPKLFSDPIQHEFVNTHGHLFTWKGSDEGLAPILLMAHIDTVPVLGATLDQWTFPPFEGKISVDATKDTPGTWIWGRGSSDCKNSLLGIYNAVEKLINDGFKPERTILIANGFDEEVSDGIADDEECGANPRLADRGARLNSPRRFKSDTASSLSLSSSTRDSRASRKSSAGHSLRSEWRRRALSTLISR